MTALAQGAFEKTKTLKPVNDQLFIKKLDLTPETSGGIYLPKRSEHANLVFLSIAEVLDVGSKVEQDYPAGSIIVFADQMMTRAQWAGDDSYGLIKEANVLALVVDKK